MARSNTTKKKKNTFQPLSEEERKKVYADEDFFENEIYLISLEKQPIPEDIIKEETPGILELGNIFLDIEVELPRQRTIDSAVPKPSSRFKHNPNLIYNEILGYVEQEVIDEALRRGAITRRTYFGRVYFCIPAEEVLIGEHNGKVLSSPRKQWKVSDKYFEFMKEFESGKFKIKKDNKLL